MRSGEARLEHVAQLHAEDALLIPTERREHHRDRRCRRRGFHDLIFIPYSCTAREGRQEKANLTEKRRSPPVYTPIAVSRRARYSVVVLVPVIGLFALPFAVSVSILLVDFFWSDCRTRPEAA